jgi:uncharacterized membrane protein
MEILRYKSNAWGQQVLEGVSWDLVGVFVAAGLLVVIFHAVYVGWRRKLRSRHAADK